MLEAQLNMFDFIVLFVLGFSALISFFRGFLREVFSLGAWLGAATITLYAYPSVAKMLTDQIGNELVANGMASMGTFIVALITISLFGSLMLKYLKPSTEVGMVDNTLGLIFGVLRGILLVAIGFYVMSLFLKPDDYPDWVKEAGTRVHVEKVAGWVGHLAPNYLSALSPNPDKAPLTDAIDDVSDAFGDIAPEADTLPETLPETGTEATDEDAPFWPTMDELQQTINESSGDNATP